MLAALCLIAYLLTLVLGDEYTQGRASRFWMRTTGTITGTRVFSCRRPLEVDYVYVAQGKTYTGHRINFLNTCGSIGADFYQQLVVEWHKDARVAVYFNPKDPSQAILRRDYQNPWYIFSWMIWPAIAVDVVLRFSLWRRLPRLNWSLHRNGSA